MTEFRHALCTHRPHAAAQAENDVWPRKENNECECVCLCVRVKLLHTRYNAADAAVGVQASTHAGESSHSPHARPSACFDLTNTYGTFLSSHSSGKCNRISRGSVSAASTRNSACDRFSVLVAAGKR